MSRILIFAATLLVASMGASAQTVIDITNQAGTATCSYPTGPVTSSTTPGHLKAQLTGTPTGSGCSTGGSGGTPAANFTYTTNGLTATFTDTSTDSGGTINAWSWTFGDSTTATTRNPSHTYAAAGTYSVTLTVTDSVNSQQSNKTQSVTVSASGGSCPAVAGDGTGGVNSFNQWTGTQSVYYFGSGPGTGYQSVDVTSFNSSWAISGTWPQSYGRQPVFPLPITNYMAQKFTVPAGYFAGAPTGIYGQYIVGSSQNDAPVSMTISTKCGDFSNPATYPGTSSVVAGCYINKALTGGFVMWSKSYGCNLADGQTYYLNMIDADISNVTPTGGTAASTTSGNCVGGVCRIPLSNQGTFNSYHP
ncbi:MAG: PKD domain-containing protein [Proteobacteria bacterium]|nr:PKD domain-containing protein [Pseudomonadota bacterium]